MDMKDILANVSFREVSLRHVVGSDWLFKVIDLVEEPDMPGLGHDFAAQFSKVLVVLSNITIDYKPVSLPSFCFLNLIFLLTLNIFFFSSFFHLSSTPLGAV